MKIGKGCLVTLALLAIGVLVSCSAEKEVSTDGAEKPMEISIAHWGIDQGLAGGEDDLILQYIQDKFNVKFVSMNITWDDADQKIQLWAASGELPDIFSTAEIGSTIYYNWVEQGVVKGLPADLSQYAHLNEYLAVDDIEAMKIDGQLYAIPRKTYPNLTWSVIDRTVVYRWDLAQEAGITKEPETWEEFEDMMLKILAADPESKNVQGLTSVGTLDGFLFTYSLPAAMGGGSEAKWMEKDGQYVPAYFAGDALPTFELARRYYENGVIEKDIALTKMQQALDKFLQGKSAALLRAGGPETLYDYAGKYWDEVYPGQDIFEDVKVLNLLPSIDGNKYYSTYKTAWSESYISARVSDEKLNKILEIYDYLISEEGSVLVMYGFEGEDYDMVDGKIVLRDLENLGTKYPFTTTMSSLVQWSKGVWDETYPSRTPDGYRELSVAKYNEALIEGTMPDFDPRYTYLQTPIKEKFNIEVSDDLLYIMMGSEPVEEMWKDLLVDYERKGLSEMIAEVNALAKEKGYQ